MKITKRQLRRIIKEEISRVIGESLVEPKTVQEWESWGSTFGLSPEYDNESQLMFYMEPDHRDFDAITREADRAGASVEVDNYGQAVIYTGMTDMGPMGPRQMRMI